MKTAEYGKVEMVLAEWFWHKWAVHLLVVLERKVVYSVKVKVKVKVKWSHYRPGVAQRVGRGIALLFHDHGTRRGWVVSSTTWPHFTPGKDLVSILQEAGWAPGLVWTGRKSRLHWDSILDRPAHSQSLYRLSYPAHVVYSVICQNHRWRLDVTCGFMVQVNHLA